MSYIREGIYMPDGNLFIRRACCAGIPVRSSSRLMWEITTGGALIHRVALGFKDEEHLSLAAARNGHWLLYLATTTCGCRGPGTSRPSWRRA
jgi:hypothetical protein